MDDLWNQNGKLSLPIPTYVIVIQTQYVSLDNLLVPRLSGELQAVLPPGQEFETEVQGLIHNEKEDPTPKPQQCWLFMLRSKSRVPTCYP